MIRNFASLTAPLIACSMLASCATGPEHRISQNPTQYANLSTRDKERVNRGQVTEGMSKDAVTLAWGRPDRVRKSSRNGKAAETWSYLGSEPVQSTSVGYNIGPYSPRSPFYDRYDGYGRRGYNRVGPMNINTGVDFIPYIAKTVEFSGNRVVAWEQSRR
tara:strand:- start:2584 stop:3063 length:480 start_codon:yes stop_codon:yes gene_type:complete